MAWNVWLGNPFEIHLDWKGLCTEVNRLLTPVVKKHDKSAKKQHRFGAASVHSSFQQVSISRQDLLIYVVPTRNFGFAGASFGSGGRLNDADGTCLTSGKQTCTEAYVAAESLVGQDDEFLIVDRLNDPKHTVSNKKSLGCLAKVIFHEAMHNRSQRFDKMHNVANLSIGKASFTCKTSVNGHDENFLARHLWKGAKDPTDWTGGWDEVDLQMPMVAGHVPRPQNSI